MHFFLSTQMETFNFLQRGEFEHIIESPQYYLYRPALAYFIENSVYYIDDF